MFTSIASWFVRDLSAPCWRFDFLFPTYLFHPSSTLTSPDSAEYKLRPTRSYLPAKDEAAPETDRMPASSAPSRTKAGERICTFRALITEFSRHVVVLQMQVRKFGDPSGVWVSAFGAGLDEKWRKEEKALQKENGDGNDPQWDYAVQVSYHGGPFQLVRDERTGTKLKVTGRSGINALARRLRNMALEKNKGRPRHIMPKTGQATSTMHLPPPTLTYGNTSTLMPDPRQAARAMPPPLDANGSVISLPYSYSRDHHQQPR